MRSGNPALNDKVFTNPNWATQDVSTMTLNGVVFKTGALLVLLSATAVFTWQQFTLHGAGAVTPYLIGGMVVGGIVLLVNIFKPNAAPFTAPIYAAAQGLVLGGISAMTEASYPGIAIQAVGLTFGTLAALLVTYSTGLIKPSENFKLGIMAATGGIALVYLATIGLGFFGIQIPLIHGNGPIGIAFSLFVVVLAAMNLVLDFDFIEEGVKNHAPKAMEWYAAFGLLVTLIWLYMEILRLLTKLRSNE